MIYIQADEFDIELNSSSSTRSIVLFQIANNIVEILKSALKSGFLDIRSLRLFTKLRKVSGLSKLHAWCWKGQLDNFSIFQTTLTNYI